MISRVPRASFALDPLIAEAKRRARRRAVIVALLAAGIAAALAVNLLPGSGGGGTPASSANGTRPAHSVQQIGAAFAARGIKLTRMRVFWTDSHRFAWLAGGNVWVEVGLATSDRMTSPGFPTNPVGMQLAQQGNVWVAFPNSKRREVAAALASLR
jgi:hypothetical protein